MNRETAKSFRNEGPAGADATSVRVTRCSCPVPHVHFTPSVGEDEGWSIVLQPDDSARLAAWLEEPGDALTLANTGGPEGDAFAKLYAQVVPTTAGERLVGLSFRCATVEPNAATVVLTLDTARVMAQHVRSITVGEKQPEGSLVHVPVPPAYALRLTLQGDELRWLSHAVAMLGIVLAPSTEDVPLLYAARREAREFGDALFTFLAKVGTVHDVLTQYVTDRAQNESNPPAEDS